MTLTDKRDTSSDPSAAREGETDRMRSSITAEVEDDLENLDMAAQVGEVQFLSRASLLAGGGTVRDIKRIMTKGDVAAIPADMLYWFLDASGCGDKHLTSDQIRKFLGVGTPPWEEQQAGKVAVHSSPFSPSAGEPETQSEVRAKGGRPRADWAEEVLIEVGGRMFDGWTPKNISAVTEAMAQWLVDNDISASDSAVKKRARALYNRYFPEG